MSFSKLILIAFLGLLLPSMPSSYGEMLNRFDRIREWAVMEEQLFSWGKAHVNKLEEELAELKRFLRDYEETTLSHLDGLKYGRNPEDPDETEGDIRADEVASNPLLIYQLSHRLVTMVPGLQKRLLKVDKNGLALKNMLAAFADPKIFLDEATQVEQLWQELGSHQKYFPVQADLEDAVESLAILYDTYQSANVTPKNFAASLSPITRRPVNISSFHAVQISLKSFFLGLYGNAIDWIMYAVKRSADPKIRDYSISKDIVHYTKDFILKTHNAELEEPSKYSVSHTSFLNSYTEPVTAEILQEEGKDRRLMKQRDLRVENESMSPEEEATLSFYSLCKLNGRPTPRNPRLRCYVEKSFHPFFILRPLKVEELSMFPKALHFYDVLGEEELEQLKLLAADLPVEMEVNGIGRRRHSPDAKGTRTLPSITGVESVIVLGEEGGGVLERLKRKAEFLAGSSVRTSRLTEYVPGRYEALQNFGELGEDGLDVKSILQFHLNSVDKGGESLLGQYGPVVSPIEGSALYWEALLTETEDGNVEQDLWSGSCPVVQGYKLIITSYFTH